MFMPATAFTPIPPRPLTDIEFCAWIGQAVPGDRLEYHRGFLGIDTTAVISTLPAFALIKEGVTQIANPFGFFAEHGQHLREGD